MNVSLSRRLGLALLLASTPLLVHAQSTEHQHHHDHQHEQAHQGHDPQSDDFSVLGAHVHGNALLTIVVDGNEAAVALQSAAYNVVGFEHKPATAEQQQEIDAAIAVLSKGEWFTLNHDANCEVAGADVTTDLTETQAVQGHSDFYANFQLLCQRPAHLREISLPLFSLLPSLERVDVQWVINNQQGAAVASAQKQTVSF